jgi:hypothetical protein
MFFWLIIALAVLIITAFLITGHIFVLVFFVGALFMIIKFIEYLIRNALKDK